MRFGRDDRAVLDRKNILAAALAHQTVRAQDNAFVIAVQIGFDTDQLRIEVVAAGLGQKGQRIGRHAVPRRGADGDAVFERRLT